MALVIQHIMNIYTEETKNDTVLAIHFIEGTILTTQQ